MRNNNEIKSPWVMSWAKKIAVTFTKHSSLTTEERFQEVIFCYLETERKVSSIEEEQGIEAAKAYMGRVVSNHLKNQNANFSTQLGGMNGATRESDSLEVRNAKKAAMSGGISLQEEVGQEEGGSLADIIPSSLPSVEEEIDFISFTQGCGILAPLLMGKVDHPVEWCEQFPGAANLLVESPALREVAVRREALKCAKFGLDPEAVTKAIMEFLDGWRGVRGEYGDGDSSEESAASFEPCEKLAGYFGKDSTFGAIALCKPLEEVPGFRFGYSDTLLFQVGSEAKALGKKLSIPDLDGFVVSCVNRARSYLRASGGLIKFHAAMERRQKDLF